MDWKSLVVSIGIGMLFAFFVYIFSDYSGSFALGVAYAYMHYKFNKLERKIGEKK